MRVCSCARVLSRPLACARQGPALPIISGRRARVGPFCAVGVAEQKWGRPAGQRVRTVRTRIHCHEESGERSAESGPRDGSWDELSQSSTGAHQSSKVPRLPPMSSNGSEMGRRLHEDRTLWKEVKRVSGGSVANFDGRAVQSRGACSPGSAGPRRVWFASLALGSWAAESPPEPASFFQADGSEAAANAANDSASVSGGREVRGQFRLRAQLASPSSPNCRAPRKGRLDRLPAGQAWYPANSPGDSDRRSLLARCVDPAAARKCVGQTRQG